MAETALRIGVDKKVRLRNRRVEAQALTDCQSPQRSERQNLHEWPTAAIVAAAAPSGRSVRSGA